MKKSLLLLTISSLLLLFACKSGSNNDQSVGNGHYGVKSGIITYKPMNMMGISITQVVYFDDYGAKETREITTQGSMMGTTIQTKAVDIREGLTNIHFELENIQNGQNVAKKEAYKQSIPKEFMEQQKLSDLSDELKKKLSYKEDGTETVAGLKGVKYTIMPDSAHPDMMANGVHYKNIPLKFAVGNIEMIADKVDFDAKVPADKFKVPAGYQIMERERGEMPAQEGENAEEEGGDIRRK
ncbi:MAG: hypothetical protein IPH88_05340 [Bacteroidales bacterium]|nr:hypothetical protein [Bacteroidales bacterium]